MVTAAFPTRSHELLDVIVRADDAGERAVIDNGFGISLGQKVIILRYKGHGAERFGADTGTLLGKLEDARLVKRTPYYVWDNGRTESGICYTPTSFGRRIYYELAHPPELL